MTPTLTEALRAAGLPSDAAKEAWHDPTMDHLDSWEAAYMVDAAAIARVVVERRLAELAASGDWPFFDNPNLGSGAGGQSDILDALFPEAK